MRKLPSNSTLLPMLHAESTDEVRFISTVRRTRVVLLHLLEPQKSLRLSWSMASLSLTQIGGGSNSVAELVRNRCRPNLAQPSTVGIRVAAASETSREPDLGVTANGLYMANPFVIGSGPQVNQLYRHEEGVRRRLGSRDGQKL